MRLQPEAFERMISGICRHGEWRVIIRKTTQNPDAALDRCVVAQAFGPEREQLLWLRIRTAQQQALRSVESVEAAGEISLEVLDVFQPDVKTQGWAARLPLRRGAIVRAIEWNNQAFKATP